MYCVVNESTTNIIVVLAAAHATFFILSLCARDQPDRAAFSVRPRSRVVGHENENLLQGRSGTSGKVGPRGAKEGEHEHLGARNGGHIDAEDRGPRCGGRKA